LVLKKLFLAVEHGVLAVKKYSVTVFLTIVIIGTTVFSDIGANYVDFFGGRSRENNGGNILAITFISMEIW